MAAYPQVRENALHFLSLDWMANLGDDASVRADEVKADLGWVARLEIAVFGMSTGHGVCGIKDAFMPESECAGTIVLKPLPDARKYELLMQLDRRGSA
jgi:hypothetical protein